MSYMGIYDKFFERGIYNCKSCNEHLFNSEHKFESGTGRPAFHTAAGKIAEVLDYRWLMKRTEALCANCGAHLGHIFDLPKLYKPNQGRKYAIHSAALQFIPAIDKEPEDRSYLTKFQENKMYQK